MNVSKLFAERPISFYPIYAEIMGSVAGGVFLSRLMDCFLAVDGKEFCKADREIREETMLTNRQIKRAKAKLKELPFISIYRKGIPGKTHYHIDSDGIITFLEGYQRD